MLVLARAPDDVFSRYHYAPGHFTASGFVVTAGEGHLLLVFHERLQKWLQPGGHIEPGDDDLWAAARREVTEETGLLDLSTIGDGLFDIDVHHIPASRGEPPHVHHDLRFLFTASGEAEAGDGVAAVTWVTASEAGTITSDRSVRRAAARIESGGAGR